MLEPHIFGSSLVTCFIILRISKLSFRFCSSATPLRNFVTLASFSLVLSSAFAMSASNCWTYPELQLYASFINSCRTFLPPWARFLIYRHPGRVVFGRNPNLVREGRAHYILYAQT